MNFRRLKSRMNIGPSCCRTERVMHLERPQRRALSGSGNADGNLGNALVLTRRESEVICLLSLGKSSKEIGSLLNISVRTAETHRANIMRKLHVHSVTELLHLAYAHKLVDL
jgi:two-component system response regulator NreC